METYPQELPVQEDILVNFENRLVQASGGKRFVNYIIDLVVFYALFFGVVVVVLTINPEALGDLEDDSLGSNILDRIISLLLYGMYMFVVEAVFKGKSLGKLITRTRAVHEDGTPLTVKTAFLRGLSRAVPFNAFSALGTPSHPWHDRWTNTYVIDEQESNTYA